MLDLEQNWLQLHVWCLPSRLPYLAPPALAPALTPAFSCLLAPSIVSHPARNLAEKFKPNQKKLPLTRRKNFFLVQHHHTTTSPKRHHHYHCYHTCYFSLY